MRKIKIKNYFEKQCLQCQLLLQPPLSSTSCSVFVSYDQDKDIFSECLHPKAYSVNYLMHFVNNENSKNDNNF